MENIYKLNTLEEGSGNNSQIYIVYNNEKKKRFGPENKSE